MATKLPVIPKYQYALGNEEIGFELYPLEDLTFIADEIHGPCRLFVPTNSLEKDSLARLLDEIDIGFDRMSYVLSPQKLVEVSLTGLPLKGRSSGIKICGVGSYVELGYCQLGFTWDGQRRANNILGNDTLFLDPNMLPWEHICEKIIEFSPDIVWIGEKKSFPILDMLPPLPRCRFLYWFGDLRRHEGNEGELPIKAPILENPQKYGEKLDGIFLTNSGQIPMLQKTFATKNVHYMPLFGDPIFHHRADVPVQYDIGFTGGLDRGIFHRQRTDLINKLSKRYKVKARKDCRNDISEFYSSCKLVFAACCAIGEDKETEFQPYLYTSNRFFIALACGACQIVAWFPGIEKLVENHKHVVWFKKEEEIYDLIDFYLAHDKEREQIGKNAQDLAHRLHTPVERVKNIQDIILGKTDKFYGFLEKDKKAT